jgi:hypothetical protein
MTEEQYATRCARRAKELQEIAAGIYDAEERRMLERVISELETLSAQARPTWQRREM